jgi:chromosome segregation ATPase
MTDETNQPDSPDNDDSDLRLEQRRPPVSVACKGFFLLLMSFLVFCIGWSLGNITSRQQLTSQISRTSGRNVFLSAQNRRLAAETNRTQQAAADAAAETAITKAHVETLQKQIAEIEQQAATRQQAMQEIHTSQQERLEKMLRELEDTRAQFKRYREAHREFLREDAKGEILGDLSYRDQTFTNAIIEGITPAGIDIRHEAGAARLLFPLLPAEMRDRFAYEPDEAAEYLAVERRHWLQNRAIADNARLSAERELQERERRIATRQAEKEVDKILEKLASAKKSLAFCKSKLGQPGRIAPAGYEWKIRQLERDITAYETQLEEFGIFHQRFPGQ